MEFLGEIVCSRCGVTDSADPVRIPNCGPQYGEQGMDFSKKVYVSNVFGCDGQGGLGEMIFTVGLSLESKM